MSLYIIGNGGPERVRQLYKATQQSKSEQKGHKGRDTSQVEKLDFHMQLLRLQEVKWFAEGPTA